MVILTEEDKRLGKNWWEWAKKTFPDRAEFINEKLKEFEMYEAVQELKKVIGEGIKY